jgi:hypothetical protein
MKKLVLTCILAVPILLSAQSNFEGVITYKGITTDEENNFELKIFYGNGKMKAKVFAPRSTYESIQIYNFETGIHHSIFEDEKTYSTDTLGNFSFEDQLSDLRDTTIGESILGYYCKSFTATTKEEKGFVDEISTVIWFPDSIKFIIPEKYRNKRDIETCDDGNMLFLKTQTIVSIHIDEEDEPKQEQRDTLLIVAIKIERMKIDESEFQLPAGYTYSASPAFPRGKRDSVRVSELTLTELVQEEELKPEPPPPPPPKDPKPLKSPSKKGKQLKPVKG